MATHEPIYYFVYTHRGLQYALPVMNILEIVMVSEWLPFHGDAPACLGNIVHRDTLLPVFDSTRLGTDLPDDRTTSDTFIIVKHGNVVFGLTMDRHLDMLTFDTVTPAEPTASPTHGDTAAVSASKPFVDTVRVFRNNTLITFSVETICDFVGRIFGAQTNITADREHAEQACLASAIETAQQTFMCARIENVSFAIPIEKVIEVTEDCDVTPLFKVSPFLRGLINLRGQVLGCIDISEALGFPPRRLDEHSPFIVLQEDNAELALCVHEVLGIRMLPQHGIQKADAVFSGEITRYVHGILETENGTMMFLSVPDIFDSPHLQPYVRQEA
jgi:purine-binding chemotaxis protein CheW